MFALIVFYIYAYASFAILFSVTGTGFILQQWWAVKISESVLFLWGITGVVFLSNYTLLFTDIFNDYSAFKQRIEIIEVAAIGSLVILVFFIVPGICLFILKNRTMRKTLNRTGFLNSFFEQYPLTVLLLLLMYLLLILFYSFSFFLKSIFPVIGVLFVNLPGTIGISVCIVITVFIILFTVRLKPWIWWVSVVLFFCMALSAIYTFSVYTFFDICTFIGFPEKEMEILEGMFVLKEFRLSLFFGSPYIVVVILLVLSRKHFKVSAARISGKIGHAES
jgi:hypothetical protein